MKTTLKTISSALIIFSALHTLSAATPGQSIPDTAVLSKLHGVPVPELPARAASIVAAAKAENQVRVAKDVIAAVHQLNPAALVAAVGAISRQVPDVAPDVAAAAVKLDARQARSFARVAAAGAPDMASKIVASVCLQAPEEFREVAAVVSRVVPQASQSIIFALGEALPEVRPYLEDAKTQVSSGRLDQPSVALIVSQAHDLMSTAQTGVGGAQSAIGGSGGVGQPAVNDGTQAGRKVKSVKSTKNKSKKKKTKKSSKKKTKKKTKSKDYSKP